MFLYDKGKTMQEGFPMDATKIGTFIAAERRAKGWTQRQLADKPNTGGGGTGGDGI